MSLLSSSRELMSIISESSFFSAEWASSSVSIVFSFFLKMGSDAGRAATERVGLNLGT